MRVANHAGLITQRPISAIGGNLSSFFFVIKESYVSGEELLIKVHRLLLISLSLVRRGIAGCS